MKKIKQRMRVLLAVFVLISIFAMDVSDAYAEVTESIEQPEEGTTEKPEKPEEGTTECPEKTEEEPTPSEPEWMADGTLKILIIGHSYAKDTLHYVYNIGKNLGISSMKLGILHISGCSLDQHLDNAINNSPEYTYYTNDQGTWITTENYKMADALNSENWDYICFQQKSASTGVPRTYDYLEPLLEIVENACPDATFAWNMTWAYQDDTDREEYKAYLKDQLVMYESIAYSVQQKIETNEKIELILPVGTAIQNARTSYLGDTLTRDGHHMSFDIGRYIAGVAFIHGLLGIDIDGLTYMPSGTGTGIKDIAIEAAKNAVLEPYSVTKSQYDLAYLEDYYYNNGKAVCVATGGAHVEEQKIDKATMEKDGTIYPTCTKCKQELEPRVISKINPINLSQTSYIYNGKTKKPTVTVLNSLGEELVQGTDYKVTYQSGRKKVGTYTVTITFKGNYSGTHTFKFNILPTATKVTKLTSKKKQVEIKWKKVSSQRTGYQIQYSKKKNFSSKKSIKITSNTNKTTIKKLSKNTRYYFRIRIYKTVDGKNYYSAWSEVKTIKTKKKNTK